MRLTRFSFRDTLKMSLPQNAETLWTTESSLLVMVVVAGDFFMINSSWGVVGYVNISAGASNVCIIISAASYPTE